MKKLFMFLKFQGLYLSALMLLIVIPMGLFFHYSPYPLPYVQYAILGMLFFWQYFTYDEKAYQQKLWPKTQSSLHRELNRPPSKNEILGRIHFIASCRWVALGIAGVAVLGLTIYYDKL